MEKALLMSRVTGLGTHWVFNPEPNPLMDDVESKILMSLATPPTTDGAGLSVLEIGTHKGGTTRNLAKIAKAFNMQVVTVDVNTAPDTIPEIQKGEVLPVSSVGSLIPDDLKKYVTQLMIEPKTLDGVLHKVGLRYWMIFIDGDHSYEGVKYDYEVCKNYIMPKRPIVFHDVCWDCNPPPVDGPLRLAKEIDAVVLNLTHLAYKRVG